MVVLGLWGRSALNSGVDFAPLGSMQAVMPVRYFFLAFALGKSTSFVF